MASARTRTYGLLVVIAISTPLALVVESAIRRMVLPPTFEEIRVWLSPTLTPWAWAMVPTAAATSVLGWWLFGVIARRERARQRLHDTPEQAQARANFEALMLSSSAPQVPALAATILFMLGAPLLPAVVAMGVATLGVLSLGVRVARPPGHTANEQDNAS